MRMQKTIPYIFTTVLALSLVALILVVFNINPMIPLNYNGDALVHYNFVKNIDQTGWWFTNPNLGSPTIQELYDFPLTENLHLVIIKLLVLLGFNWYMSVNIFYILTFPLTAVFSLFVLRKLNIQTAVAIPLAIIYAFIPFHFYRGVNHLFLSAYFTIPISILTAYHFASAKTLNIKQIGLLGFAIASSGAYYTFFSGLFILIGVLLGIKKPESKKVITSGLLLITSIFFFFILNALPTIAYQYKYGNILNTTVRSPSNTEIYGLKIIQLILPIEDHNISLFNKIYKQYETNGLGITINENQYASLGLVGSLGFLTLLFWIGFKHKLSSKYSDEFTVFSIFNLAALLYATSGGFGLIFSTYINPVFRSVNRISIFIAFFAIIAVGLILQDLLNRKWATILAWIILPIALYDQISIGVLRNFTNNHNYFDNLAVFAKEIETTVGKDAKIYTLPFGLYPEGNDKKLMKLALLTNSIKWSTGAASWRAANQWQFKQTQLDIKPFLDSIVSNNFKALVIYLPDYDTQKLKELELLIGEKEVIDKNKEFGYFDLTEYTKKHPKEAKANDLFYYISGNCVNNFDGKILNMYWCVNNVRIEFENLSESTLAKHINLVIESPQKGRTEYSQNITIPSGKSHIVITKDITEKGFFPIPRDELTWPLHLGYPNLKVSNITIN